MSTSWVVGKNPGAWLLCMSWPFERSFRGSEVWRAAEGYCKAWGCETTGDAYWNPSSTWDLITVKRKQIPGYTGHGPWVCGSSGQKQDCGPCYDVTRQRLQGATPGGKCNPLLIQFTEAGKRADWSTLKTWGLRLHRSGYDPYTLFSISRSIAPTNSELVGPNPVLSDEKSPTIVLTCMYV